jgi:hypothetical protein
LLGTPLSSSNEYSHQQISPQVSYHSFDTFCFPDPLLFPSPLSDVRKAIETKNLSALKKLLDNTSIDFNLAVEDEEKVSLSFLSRLTWFSASS